MLHVGLARFSWPILLMGGKHIVNTLVAFLLRTEIGDDSSCIPGFLISQYILLYLYLYSLIFYFVLTRTLHILLVCDHYRGADVCIFIGFSSVNVCVCIDT